MYFLKIWWEAQLPPSSTKDGGCTLSNEVTVLKAFEVSDIKYENSTTPRKINRKFVTL